MLKCAAVQDSDGFENWEMKSRERAGLGLEMAGKVGELMRVTCT